MSTADRPQDAARARQSRRLRELLAGVGASRFYAAKFAGLDPTTAALTDLPFTTKAELAADQAAHPPYGSGLTRPPAAYNRMHQTSGTSTGRPLRWFDTRESWDRLLGSWDLYLTRWFRFEPGRDVLFFPFSFGPFLGFWTAWEAATRAGFLCLPGGGMGTTPRLRFLLDHRPTVLFCTPTYALHLAEVAAAEEVDLAGSSVRAVVVAGEPGAGVATTRQRIETAFGARVFDQYGLTEVGPAAAEPADDPGNLVVHGDEYVAEVIAPDGTDPVAPGEVGELVLTTLGRTSSPLIRYRTGDLVRSAAEPCPVPGVRLAGGVLGRTDDMIHVRGNNLYPTAIEAVVRRFPEVAEFRIVVDQSGPLADLRIEVEPTDAAAGPRLADAVRRAIRDELLFRPEVTAVPPGTLPRFEMKARRVVRT